MQTVGITRADRWGSRGRTGGDHAGGPVGSRERTGGITRADRCIAESASKRNLRKRTFEQKCVFLITKTQNNTILEF